MTYRGIPHHKVVIQNLYSSKANWSKALRHGYTIAQARSDVFFSLLFGGQVCLSAGAFFDSPIAIHVFGELCSHDKFDSFCSDYGWRPLWLNTDRRSEPNADPTIQPSPVEFITSRWRDKRMSFTFFRESESGFNDPEKMSLLKENASSALEGGEYGSLGDLLAPLYQDHEIARYDSVATTGLTDPDPAAETLPDTLLVHDPSPAIVRSILTDKTGIWFKGLMDYLTKYKSFEHRDTAKNPSALDEFFPLKAILERTKNIDGTSNLHSKVELDQLNADFLKELGNQPTMNPIHIKGPEHYGPIYYPLIEYWMEMEWHQVRHRLYGAQSCILSSDWHMREMFDFDRASMATYVRDVRIDDSLRVTQEGFGEIAWDVLFATISDKRWRDLLVALRGEVDRDRRRKHADGILNLLASKWSEFHIEHKDGFVSISVKRGAATLGYAAAYAGVVRNHHNTLDGLLGTHNLLEVVAAPVGLVAANSKPVTQMLNPLVKGARYALASYKGRQLRRTIVTDIYGV